MIILALRTDKPEAELYLYDGNKKLAEIKWQAHRELTKTIHVKIQELLALQGQSLLQGLALQSMGGIVCFKGPGSFTGLRIGMSVVNALAYAQNIPIVSKKGQNWIEAGVTDLLAGKDEKIITPFYGRPANITLPKK